MRIFIAFFILVFLSLSPTYVAAESPPKEKPSIFRNPEKIILFVESPQCSKSIEADVHRCYPNIPKSLPLSNDLKTYNLEKFLEEFFKTKYAPSKRFSKPEFDSWGRKGQPVEIIDQADALGEKAIKYKQDKNILFVKLYSSSVKADLVPEPKYFISLQIDIWRYDPVQSPYINRNYNCLVNPYKTNEEINSQIHACFSAMESDMAQID